jgi:hypothetical protein
VQHVVGQRASYVQAATLFAQMCAHDELIDFLTLPLYEQI